MSRATNSFHHIRANAAGADASKQSDALRVAISGAITVLTKALDGSVALEDIEKAVFDLIEQHPPTLMFSEVEVELCSMVRTIVLAGNARASAPPAPSPSQFHCWRRPHESAAPSCDGHSPSAPSGASAPPVSVAVSAPPLRGRSALHLPARL